MLKLEAVHTRYGLAEALKGVSLEVRPGEIVALIGANGAGKSTTLMTISGMVPISGGGIEFNGAPIAGRPPHEITRLGICQVPEGRRIFPNMTVLENLEMGAFGVADGRAAAEGLAQVFDYFPILSERRTQLGGTLSGGEQQMLAIGRALMARPTLLLLDEPSLGLAPLAVKKIFGIIQRINREGRTILLVEQNARAALCLAHRGYVMESGRIVMTDQARVLLDDPRVCEAYLGES
ncbi:MAG: ABC transporter ATP-binding protein [Nitrospirota bacterium]